MRRGPARGAGLFYKVYRWRCRSPLTLAAVFLDCAQELTFADNAITKVIAILVLGRRPPAVYNFKRVVIGIAN